MPASALLEHLRSHALRTDGPFTLRSGAVVDWYIDARQTTFDGSGARAVGAAVLAALADDVEAVGGLTMGADPIAVATAIAGADAGRSLRAFSIRKTAKEHGTGGRLVGPVVPGTRVCLLEDTSTTGGAFFEAHEAAVDAGLDIIQAICLVDRSDGRVADGMARRSIPYTALFTPADLGVG
jgi:orotate phosphoribosyltransferase